MTINPENSYPDVTGVMLAGGKSFRMGRDKATLEISGRTLADRMLDLLQSFFPRTIIVGDRPDLARPGIEIFPDIHPGSSLGGLHTGLTHASTDWIFVGPCDMPFPDAGLLEQLLDQRGTVAAVVPRSPLGFEPLFALYHKDCLPHLEAMLQQGNFRIYDFYTRVRVNYLDPSSYSADWQRLLYNINSPEDLLRLEKEKK